MTERRGVVRSALLAAGLLAALSVGVGCTDSHGMAGPKGSTETGNPPVIDSGAVSLVVSENAVHVVGEPGAVMPPEGTVEITVVGTGKKITGTVNDDGSFDVQVDGTLDDVFEVRVVRDGKSSEIITVKRGGAMVGGADAGMMPTPPNAACAELDQRVRNGAAMVAASVDTSCDDDHDCTIVFVPNSCRSESCELRYVSQTGKAQFEAGLAQVESIVCTDFDALGCKPAPGCFANPVPPVCIAGTCRSPSSPDPCADCDDFEIRWSTISAGTLPAEITGDVFTIAGCGTFTTTSFDMRTCSTELSGCGVMGSGWKERLDALIADPDVSAALAMGGTYGESEEYSGFVHEISVRGSTFRFRECNGLRSRMCEPPAGMRDLVAFLQDTALAQRCDPGVDCTSPWDPGPTDGALPVFWHDPQSRTCLPRVYGLTGGNGNRYMTLEDCQAACPPPTQPADCPDGRTFVTSRCVDCGPIGPCLNPVDRCLASCESDEDCAVEAENLSVAQCVEGLCELRLFCL